ncbi:MAG: STAS-like domain-containing protein [Alphaproteobacteria bacterium]|nr:STAS-like domain-containing protein [Alphaproteobacteria bacterium]
MKKKVINIAKDFSRYPYGRLRQYSNTSGEAFREDHLKPALFAFDEIMVEMDGTEGYGSSFLDEAFGNLVRKEKIDKAIILKKLKFISKDDPSLIDEINVYINEA